MPRSYVDMIVPNSPMIVERGARSAADSHQPEQKRVTRQTAKQRHLTHLEPACDPSEDPAARKVVERAPSNAPATAACASISPHKKELCAESPTDRVLTFLQTAREQNIPVRSGKWNPQEEAYLRRLVELFCLGVLDEVAQKASMRAWLAHMLNCCPMRISKKQMSGANFTGKAKFMVNHDAINSMTQGEYDEATDQLCYLRASFLKQWAKDEFARRTTIDEDTSFEEWYSKALGIVPHPRIAKNPNIVESKRWQPEPESMTKLHEQIEEARARVQQRRADVNAVSSRSLKRQRVGAHEGGCGEFAGFQNLMRDACLPEWASPNVIPLDHTPSAHLSHDQVSERWMAVMQAEPEISPAQDYIGIHCSSLPPAHATAPYSEVELESQFHCNERLSPREVKAAVQFDFGVPSKWDYHRSRDVGDMPSQDLSVWEDNDLLLDGFAILADPSLVLWEDYEHAADAWGHPAFKPGYPGVPY